MTDLLQLARDIAADQYVRLAVKNPTQFRTLREWAEHIPVYEGMLRSGDLDNERDVQSALAALRLGRCA